MHSFRHGLLASLCCCMFALVGCGNNRLPDAGSPSTPINNHPVSGSPITTTAKAKFVYTGNQGASISGFSVDTAAGALTALSGFPVPVGVNSQIVAVDPQSRFLLVGDLAGSELHVFSINSSTGALSEIAGSPYPTVHEPVSIVVDPSGTHVYVASQGSNSVGGFSLSATGALTPIPGSPFATTGTQNFGDDVVINAAGTFVYVQDTVNIYVYSVSASSGALTLVQTIVGPSFGAGSALDSIGNGIALDPHGNYLYAVASGPNWISAYSIDASTGLLTLAKSSPMVEPETVEPEGAYTIAISPTGQFAYTIENNNYLVSYALNDGTFTPTGGVYYSHVYGLRVGIDPSGSFVYVPQACTNCPGAEYNVVNEFSIGSTGALTKISGSPVAAGTTPWGIAFTTQ